MLSNLLKTIKIDRNTSEFWRIMCENITLTLLNIVVLLHEYFRCFGPPWATHDPPPQSGFTAHLAPKLTGHSPQSLYNPYKAWRVRVEPDVLKLRSCVPCFNSSERQLSVCSSLMISVDMQKCDIMLRYSLHDVSVF